MCTAWVMKLKPGNEAIYKQKHDEIWPEMLGLMERDGAHNFSIDRYGLLLFAYQERDTRRPMASRPTRLRAPSFGSTTSTPDNVSGQGTPLSPPSA